MKFIENLIKSIETKLKINRKDIIIIMDNAKIHVAMFAIAFFNVMGVKIHFNPSYTPVLNSSELVF